MQGESFHFSTADVPPVRRLARWREMVNERFVELDVAPSRTRRTGASFNGAAQIRELGELKIAHVRASSMSARRTRRQAEGSPEGDYLVGLHLRGRAVAAQDGRPVTLRPGDLALFDSARPYVIDFHGANDFEHIIYQIPRQALEARFAAAARATAIRVSLQSDEGRVVAPYLRALARASASILPTSAERLSASGLDLLTTALAAAAGLRPDTAAPERGTVELLKQYALSRLGDPRLSPAEVARARFISVRHLHRLFASEEMTFGAYVREQRLLRCRGDLADPRLRNVSIAELARRSGFTSAAHFTRAFTARYGVGPRDYRAHARRPARPARAPDARLSG